MILNRPLTPEEQAVSKLNYRCYNAVNGFSYMCLGETVLILFAVKLGCSDSIVAVLGAMLYFGYVLLPLGKLMTARVGAARSQADFWVMRNIAALLVGAAAPVALYVSIHAATAMLLLGAFLFYGFRAAGVVMSQPLVGEICEPKHQGTFIARSWLFFYTSGFIALLLITGLTKMNESVWMLFAIILLGTVCGIVASGFIRRIKESGEIRNYAARPILPEIRAALGNSAIRQQLVAGMACNLSIILVIPICILTLKRGYCLRDSAALFFSIIQFAAQIFGSWLLSKIADRFGGKRLTLAGFYCFYAIVIFWILAPGHVVTPLFVLPFFLTCGSVIMGSSMTQYFLRTVPKAQQVAATIVISVATGVVSGLLGMVVSSSLLKAAAHFNSTGSPVNTYRLYYIFVLCLLPAIGFFIHRLKKDD